MISVIQSILEKQELRKGLKVSFDKVLQISDSKRATRDEYIRFGKDEKEAIDFFKKLIPSKPHAVQKGLTIALINQVVAVRNRSSKLASMYQEKLKSCQNTSKEQFHNKIHRLNASLSKVICILDDIVTPKSKKIEVLEIEKTFKDNGIDANFSDNIYFANVAKQVLSEMLDLKIKLPKVIRLSNMHRSPSSLGENVDISGRIEDNEGILIFNNKHDWTLPIMNKKDFADGTIKGIINHEHGHFLRNKTEKKFLSESELDYIKNNVSKYAAEFSDGREFVAEVYSGIMAGKKYDSKIMELYINYGGYIPSKG